MKTLKQPAYFVPLLILLAGLVVVITMILFKEVAEQVRPFYPFIAFVYLVNINFMLWNIFLRKK